MDMFPTILASLGAQIEGDRLGIGTNLFSNKTMLSYIKAATIARIITLVITKSS